MSTVLAISTDLTDLAKHAPNYIDQAKPVNIDSNDLKHRAPWTYEKRQQFDKIF
jgi:hypothetical protein